MDPIRDEQTLRSLYPEPAERALSKDIGRIDELASRLIAASPMAMLASFGADGRVDVTPRGGPPGFIQVLGAPWEGALAIPDATGNRRLDSLANIVATGRAGLLFLIPGRDTTLRVNGRAAIYNDPALITAVSAVGKPPVCVIVLEPEEVYAHCPKAFIRSGLWNPDSWPDPAELPTSAEVTQAHLPALELTIGEIEDYERQSIRERLA